MISPFLLEVNKNGKIVFVFVSEIVFYINLNFPSVPFMCNIYIEMAFGT